MGWFGFTVTAGDAPPQPRHRAVVNIDEAHASVADVLTVWRSTSLFPDAPAFTGGVFDAWPHRIAQGLALLRAESQALQMYLMKLKKEPARG